MVFFSRLKVLYKFLFYKNFNTVLNGTEIRFDKNTFVIRTKFIEQEGIVFQNCDSDFVQEIKRHGVPDEFVQEAIVSHSNSCAAHE